MKEPSVKKNYIFRLLYEILTLIAPLITTPYISRVLGADGVGIYSYTSSIMSYFTMFAALGTASYGAREIAQHRDDQYMSSKLFFEIELMTVFTSMVCIVAWVALIFVSMEYRYYFLALLPMLFGTMFDISWYFTGYEKIKYIVIRNTVCKLVGITLLFLLVKEKSDLTLYILINSIITLLGNMSMWISLPGMLARVDIRTLQIKRHFRETLLYFIPTIATSIYTVLDKTLIGLITQDNYQNGYYEQATKIINTVKTAVFSAVNSVMGARMSWLFSQGRDEEIHNRIGRSMDFILLLGYGVVFGILAVAGRFVPAFFGDGYEPVISLLCLMTPLVLIIGISNCLGSQYYTPAGLRTKSAKYIIAGSAVNLCLNLCLIPILGATGAVFASIVAEALITVLYVANCDGYIRVKQIWNYSWKRLIAGTIMYLVVSAIAKLSLGSIFADLLMQVVVGVCVYGVLLLILKDSMVYEGIAICKNLLKKMLHN